MASGDEFNIDVLIDSLTALEAGLEKKNKLNYFGSLTEESLTRAGYYYHLKRKNEFDRYVHSGFLSTNYFFDWNLPFFNQFGAPVMTYVTESEAFHFTLNKNNVKVLIEGHHEVKKKPIIYQALTKEDWFASEQKTGLMKGNYCEHIDSIRTAINGFRKSKNSELWLPSFLQLDS